jgi:hypothetical protein
MARIDGDTGEQADSCAVCRFWESESVLEGICRRMPPAAGGWVPGREGEQVWHGARWPRTLESDVCGEFRAGEPLF